MIELRKVVKSYHTPLGEVHALGGIDLQIDESRCVVIHGPSGSGKTTLLMTIAAMLKPTSGSVHVDGDSLIDMSLRQRYEFRMRKIGFVFQLFYLVPYLTVIENVLLNSPRGRSSNGEDKTKFLLEKLGLERRAHHKPSELSAGEIQRTAIARAVIHNPRILIADEPTGNLDSGQMKAVLDYLSGFHKEGKTVIISTHRKEAEPLADQVIYLKNGRICDPPS